MKSRLFIAAIPIAIWALSVQAALATPSCQDLRNMVSGLNKFSDAVGNTAATNGSLDGELWDLVMQARYLASVEQDETVTIAADGVLDAWNGNDQDLYLRNSDHLAGRLEYFLNRDC